MSRSGAVLIGSSISSRPVSSKLQRRCSRPGHVQCSAGIERPDIRKLAQMANISVTDEEVAAWEPQLEQIIDWFGQLQAVDVDGVPPATRADFDSANRMRPDVPRDATNRDALLSQVPSSEGPYVKVPKILNS